MDANMEKSIESIGRWHSAHNAELREMRKELQNIKKKFQEAEAERKREHDETIRKLQSMLRTACAAFSMSLDPNSNDGNAALLGQQLLPQQNGGPGTRASTGGRKDKNSNNNNNNNKASNNARTSISADSSFTMVPKHKTLQEMWNEWHGKGKYKDSHGGIAGRNIKFGPKWRQHLPTGRYSRTSRIIKMIESKSQADKCSIKKTLEKLQPLFDECHCRLAVMVTKCQELGYIPKQKPRGRKRSIQDVSTNNSEP